MTEEELRALVARDEEQNVEFKLENEPQPLLASVIGAMANASGGWLLVGVTDHGQIVGVSRPKIIIDRVHSALGSIEPSLTGRVRVESVTTADAKTVVVAHVPADLRAIYAVGGVYRMRVGSYSKLLTFEQAQALAYRRGILHYEQTPVPDLPVETLNTAHLDTFLSRHLRSYTPTIQQTMPRMELLRNLGCVVTEQAQVVPTVTAALFFSDAADLFVPGAYIIAARFAGVDSTRVLDRASMG